MNTADPGATVHNTTDSQSSEFLVVKAQAERSGVPVGKKTELAVAIDLQANGDAVGGPRPSLAVSFVLDSSGSMGGDPLQQVKDSVERLIELLSPSDSVGVVAFADNPVVLCERALLTPQHKQALRRRLQALAVGGGTGMSLGVQSGAGLLGERRDNERQVLMLLTDGAPTDGSSKESLGAIVQSFRPDVSTSTLGYGPNHQADLLDGVAKAGGGQYWYIPDPNEAQVEFARALGAQGDVVVDAVELVLVPGEGVEILEVLEAQRSRVSASGLVVPRPDLRSGQTHTTIVRLLVDADAEARRIEPLTITVRYRKAGQSKVETASAVVVADVVHGEPGINAEALRKVALAKAELKRAEARRHADQGRFDAAAVVLRELVKQLEALPGYVKMDGGTVSQAVEQLIDEIQAYETKPTAQQYMEFRSTNLAVDLSQGGRHQADHKAQSETSRALMAGVVDQTVIGDIVVTEKGGVPYRVPLAGEVTIGRMPGNDIVLGKGNISKRHTRILARDGKVMVVDLKTTNGTFMNGQRVNTPRVMGEADIVHVGDFTLRFEPKTP